MNISQLNPEKLTDDQMTNLLFSGMEDDMQSGDCIFVAGSSKAVQYRLPKAVELYKQGRASKILFSGGVKWDWCEDVEAITLKKKAIALGVPGEDILVETESVHTLENVLASQLVLSRAFFLHNMKRIIVVTSHYHMRRLHLTLKTYMPSWINYTLCPTDDINTQKSNWFLSDFGRKRVETESKKLISYVKQGALLDEEINSAL